MDFLHWITGLVWPARCLGCGTFDCHLCRQCLDTLDRRPHQECIICKRQTRDGVPCRACAPHTMVDHLLVAGQADHPLLAKAIHTFKYSYVYDLAGPLAEYLAGVASKSDIISMAGTDSPLFVPIPLHARRLAERGFNQSELIARTLADRVGMTCQTDAVIRTRNTASQVGTASRWERLENMRDAFCVPRPELVAGRSIVLIDDVCTTGATLDSCARVLRDAGAQKIIALALARG